jgi:hypothetical protein
MKQNPHYVMLRHVAPSRYNERVVERRPATPSCLQYALVEEDAKTCGTFTSQWACHTIFFFIGY